MPFFDQGHRKHTTVVDVSALGNVDASLGAEVLVAVVAISLEHKLRKNSEIHIDVSHSRQPLVKGERLVRYEVNTVMHRVGNLQLSPHEVNDCSPLLAAGTSKHSRLHLRTGMHRSPHMQTHPRTRPSARMQQGPLQVTRDDQPARRALQLLTRGSLGVLLLAMCQARATRKSVWINPRPPLPREK